MESSFLLFYISEAEFISFGQSQAISHRLPFTFWLCESEHII